MTDEHGLVRRRINGWHIDEMLDLCNKISTDEIPGAIGPVLLDKINELFRVTPNCFEEYIVSFGAEQSALIYPTAIPDENKNDHPTMADVYFGWFSFEQYLAMKLAQSIVTNPRYKTTLRELLGLHKRTPGLQGLLDSFLAPDSVRKYYGTMLGQEQRTQYVLVIELILFAMMGEAMADMGANEHRAVCKKILDKLDRCFRDDWVFCKNIYTNETRALIESNWPSDEEFLDKILHCLQKLSHTSLDGEGGDIAEISCVRFFMMTRKLPVSSLDDFQKLEYADIFANLIEVAHHEYSLFSSNASCLRLSGPDEDRGTFPESVSTVWQNVQTEILNPKGVFDFHLPTPEKPVSPPYAARSILSCYGISFCRLASLYGTDATHNALVVGFTSSVEQTVPFGQKMSAKSSKEGCAKGTADDVYYLAVIDMLSRAYAEAMEAGQYGPSAPGCNGDGTGIDAEQFEFSLSLADENSKLREQIKQLNAELTSARENVPGLATLVNERVTAEVEAYKAEKDAQAAAKMQKKDERIARLENRVNEAMAATRRVMEKAGSIPRGDAAGDEAETAPERELSQKDFAAIEEGLKDLKVYIFGGHANWRKKIKNAFPYIPIIPTESYVKYGDALANADIIIVNTFHCSHKAFDAIASAAKKGDARLIYVERENNPNGVGRLLMKSLRANATREE